ncbi:phenylalanyl-tRNA synthetase beta subunit [Mariprofundus aestuarium]|uniref:Phenylalanine--tRNA ligase beta subunit n=1 Tax=Mariprofundus aestuarium TaxID=1921086 RepID=A0A2K8KW00_MARES|nr:phenylalanine--tRNA ligase subunit beta [Mariprofundus aestuarium]ATX79035.1 phenylalanyl-tRNA synthetase beta subunit [Mariprofundus aestuarium]
MKIPFSWLKEHVALTKSAAEIADDLVRLGHEVEGVEEPRAAVKGVLVGHILSKEAHPDADKLSLLKVDVAGDAPLDIVCGAANMDAGDKVPVATIGTTLPNGLTIKKGAIRGQTSFGMCCSEVELGLADESAGLLILPKDAPVGAQVGEYLGLEEAVFDLSITPNRGDCMNARGIARDLAADYGLKLADIPGFTPQLDASVSVPSISVENEVDCPLYLGRRIEGIKLKESPAWMQAGLIMAGMRPINGIVDVLNYVMLYFGQPMHAFDADKLSGQISVRSADKGEAFAALDGRSLKLHDGDLVVADATGVVALAGVMGSEPTGVTESTINIMLESAFFRPARVSETRRSNAMVSEASMRFERGVDPQMVVSAMQQATRIIVELFGGKASDLSVAGSADSINSAKQVHCSVSRLESRLGVDIPESVDEVLRRMGFNIVRNSDRLEVLVPQFRHDVSIPEDMSEEYARVIGFDAIPEILPALATTAPVKKDRSIHEAVAGGFLQVVTYAFISAEEQRLFVADDGADIELENPISDAMSVMRRSGWPGLLNTAKYNLNRQQSGVALAEQGRIYMRTPKGNSEYNVLTWLMTGEVESDQWFGSARIANFFDLKGAVESWLAGRGLTGRFIADDSIQGLQAGQSAKILIGRNEAGRIGKVDGDIAGQFDIDAPVFVAEINLDLLHDGKQAKFMPLPEFPGVERDLVFLMDRKAFVRNSGSDAILQQVRKSGGKLLIDTRIFDLYEGKGVPEGMISVGVRFALQDPTRTLTQQDSDAASKAIIEGMEQKFGATLRG